MDSVTEVHCYDVDNTIFNGYTQRYLIDHLCDINIISLRFKILTFFWFLFYKLGFIKNLDRPINNLLRYFKDINILEYNKIFDDFFIKHIKDRIYKDAVDHINGHLNMGHKVVFISTSLEPIISRIARYIGVDNFFATKVLFYNDICQGSIHGKVMEGGMKVKIFDDYLKTIDKNIKISTYFYTDSFTDLPLLQFVQKPQVVNPDKKLNQLAKNKNWPIIYFN